MGWETDPGKRSGYRAHHRREACRKAGIRKEEGIHMRNTSAKIRAVAFAHSAGGDLYASLKQTFNPKEAENLCGLVLLRAAFGDIKDYQIQDRYEKSRACRILPGCDGQTRRPHQDKRRCEGNDWNLCPLGKKDHEPLGKLGL